MMSNDQEPEPREEELKTAYTEVCRSYQGIDDFRAKCLGFLPLVSGTGIFLLFSDTFIKNGNPASKYLPFLGICGIFVTLGLLFYEMRGFQRCIRLIIVGQELETKLHVKGLFLLRPHSVGRFINEPIAAGIIYSTVLASWVYVALISSSWAVWIAVAIFLISFISVWCFYLTQREPKKALTAIWKENLHRLNSWLHSKNKQHKK